MIRITLLLLLTACAASAQTKQQLPASAKPKQDTLVITAAKLPAAAKFGNDVYRLQKVTPGQKSYGFDLNEQAVMALFQCLDQSAGPHVQIEQLKALLRDQLKSQVDPQ